MKNNHAIAANLEANCMIFLPLVHSINLPFSPLKCSYNRSSITSPLHNSSIPSSPQSSFLSLPRHFHPWGGLLVAINQTSSGVFGHQKKMQNYLLMLPTMELVTGPWFPRKQVHFKYSSSSLCTILHSKKLHSFLFNKIWHVGVWFQDSIDVGKVAGLDGLIT